MGSPSDSMFEWVGIGGGFDFGLAFFRDGFILVVWSIGYMELWSL